MGHPILEAEVLYAARYEFCCSAEDFLLRRSRLAFLDVHTAGMVVPKVVSLLSRELRWGYFRAFSEGRRAMRVLETFTPV